MPPLPPLPLVLRPPVWHRLGYIVLAVLLAALGAYVFAGGDRLLGGAVLGLGALGLAVFAPHVVPGAERLRVTREGFGVTTFWRERFTPWSDVEHFMPQQLGLHGSVAGRLSPEGRARLAEAHPRLARLSKGVALLPSTYGLDASELADLLNAVRTRHAALNAPSDGFGGTYASDAVGTPRHGPHGHARA